MNDHTDGRHKFLVIYSITDPFVEPQVLSEPFVGVEAYFGKLQRARELFGMCQKSTTISLTLEGRKNRDVYDQQVVALRTHLYQCD